MRHPLASFTVAAMLALTPARALADDSTAEARALQLFEQSAERYRQGRFREAVELLEEAYRLSPEAVLLYNLGRAYEGLGDTAGALDAYTRYLAADPNAADRGSIESRVATLERQLEERRALERRQQNQRDAPQPSEAESPSLVPWVVAGVGLAGVGAGAVLGVLSGSREDDASAPATSALDAAELQSEAQTLATGANIAFVAGGAVALAGVVWGIVDLTTSGPQPAPAASSQVVLRVAPGWAGVTGRF